MRKKGKFAAFLGLVFCSFSLALGGLFGLKMSSGAIESRATASSSGTYNLVTSTTGIQSGDTVILVNNAKNRALQSISTTSTKYGIGTEVSDSNNTITLSKEDVEELTVENGSTTGTFSFKGTANISGYLHWSSDNSLTSNPTKSSNSSWTLTNWHATNGMTIANAQTNTRILRYNTGSPRFACYTSNTGTLVRLYKKVGTVAVTGVSLTKSSTTISVGSTETLTATIAPDNASNKNVTWTSSNSGVATVDGSGVVTGVAPGSADITVTTQDGGFTATCAVTIQSVAVTGVSLTKSSTIIEVGSTETLTAAVAPEDASNKSVTWTSSNTDVATVSSGVVTGVAAGSATITVTTEEGEFTATCTVTVETVAVTGVSLNKSSTTINVGSTETLTATVAPANATNKNATWSSSNTSVATVSNGIITAVAVGSATITVTTEDGGFTAACSVEVNQIKADTLTVGMTGATETKYVNWSGKSATNYPVAIFSNAVYAGNSANNSGNIQLRASDSSGIVSTVSGGTLKKVTVTWGSGTASGRTVDVYGKATAYASSGDLYENSTRGTKIGSIVYGTSTELVVTGSYEYLGIRSNSGALYLTNIVITWEDDALTSIEAVSPKTTFSQGEDWTFGPSASVTATRIASGEETGITTGLTFELTDKNKENPQTLDGSHTMSVAEDGYFVKVSMTEAGVMCSDYYAVSVSYVPVESIVIDQGTAIELPLNFLDYQFSASIEGENADQSVNWSSASSDLVEDDDYYFDPDTARLSVMASAAGTIVITATTKGEDEHGDNLSAECVVTVTDVKSVRLDKSSITALHDDESVTITATPFNFVSDSITYSWVVRYGAQCVSLTNTDQPTVTVNFVKAGSGTIRCTATESGGSAYADCSVTVTNGGATFSWTNRGELSFYKGDKFALNPGSSLSVNFANEAIEDIPDLSLSDSRLSLVIFETNADASAIANGREVSISTYEFLKSDNGKYIRIKYSDAKHEAYTNLSGASQLNIINWRLVTKTESLTGSYDFSKTTLNSASAISHANSDVAYSNLETLPDISDAEAFYIGNKSEDGGLNTNNVARIGASSKDGEITFTFPTERSINALTIEAQSWNDENPTLTVSDATDSTKDFAVTGTKASHTFALESSQNSITISSTAGTGHRAFIFTIDFSFDDLVTNISKTSDCLGLESFIDQNMHVDDIPFDNDEETNACLDEGTGAKGYFTTAKTAFLALNEEQRALFMTNSAYGLERARLIAWAAANGKSIVLEDGDYVFKTYVIPRSYREAESSPLTTTLWIVLGSGLAGLTAIGFAYWISKKRRPTA